MSLFVLEDEDDLQHGDAVDQEKDIPESGNAENVQVYQDLEENADDDQEVVGDVVLAQVVGRNDEEDVRSDGDNRVEEVQLFNDFGLGVSDWWYLIFLRSF